VCEIRTGRFERQPEALQGIRRGEVKRILVDTGPLVAILSRHDQFHEICTRTLKDLTPPLLSNSRQNGVRRHRCLIRMKGAAAPFAGYMPAGQC
jgi:hypothetical protein